MVLKKLQKAKVLVVGDLILDRYIFGSVERISPEAPVPVLRESKEKFALGGASNVALNIASLGAEVYLAGRVSNDLSGAMLKNLLGETLIDFSAVVIDDSSHTVTKSRFIAESHHLLRVDRENFSDIAERSKLELMHKIEQVIDNVHSIVISDYAKGLLTKEMTEWLIVLAQSKNLPILVDPKGGDYEKYRGATIIKPNFKEAVLASKLDSSAPIRDIAGKILETVTPDYLLITRSEKGMALFDNTGAQLDFPASKLEVIDVTGAGDTSIALLGAAIAADIDLHQAIELANLAAGIVVQRVGCSAVTLAELAHEILKKSGGKKIFYEEQIKLLQLVLGEAKGAILEIRQPLQLNHDFLLQIKKSKEKGIVLLVGGEDRLKEAELRLLSLIPEIDYIIITETSSLTTLSQLDNFEHSILVDA